jgi:hypothetical protein
MANAIDRAAWVKEIWDEIAAHQEIDRDNRAFWEGIINRIRRETPSMGKGKAWQGAVAWFEHEDSAAVQASFHGEPITVEYLRWLAIQSMIWFAREG